METPDKKPGMLQALFGKLQEGATDGIQEHLKNIDPTPMFNGLLIVLSREAIKYAKKAPIPQGYLDLYTAKGLTADEVAEQWDTTLAWAIGERA